jgi:hypothetical protein
MEKYHDGEWLSTYYAFVRLFPKQPTHILWDRVGELKQYRNGLSNRVYDKIMSIFTTVLGDRIPWQNVNIFFHYTIDNDRMASKKSPWDGVDFRLVDYNVGITIKIVDRNGDNVWSVYMPNNPIHSGDRIGGVSSYHAYQLDCEETVYKSIRHEFILLLDKIENV